MLDTCAIQKECAGVIGRVVVIELPSFSGRRGEMNIGMLVGDVEIPRQVVEGNVFPGRGREFVNNEA